MCRRRCARQVATRCSWGASVETSRTQERLACSSSATTCERAPRPTPSRSPSCWRAASRPRALADELYELMRCAPSTRRFLNLDVDRGVIERVLDNARFAPSGGNRQGWRVVVVTDPDTRRRLRELYERPWDEYMIQTGGRAALDAGEASAVPAGRLRMLQGADEYAHTFDRVPVHLVICVEIAALAIVDSSLDRP